MSESEMHAALLAAEDSCRKVTDHREGQRIARDAAKKLRGKIVELRDVSINEMVSYENADRWHNLETLAGQKWWIAVGCTADMWEDPGAANHAGYAQEIFQDLGLSAPVDPDPNWWREQPVTVVEVVTAYANSRLVYGFFVHTQLIPDLRKNHTITVRIQITNIQVDRVFGRLVTLESEGKVLVDRKRAFAPLSHL